MAGQLQQPALPGCVVRGDGAQQRRPAQIDAVARGVDVGGQRRRHVGSRLLHRQPLQRQARCAHDHLHGPWQPLPQHGGAQRVVARDQPIEGGDEALQPLAAVEGQGQRRDVGVALGLQPVVEQHAFLQRRERVDVGDVGGAAGHAGFDARALRGIELHQRGGFGGGAQASRRGRHLCLCFSQRLREGRHRGVLEQQAHRRRIAQRAHTLQQAQRQQRMAAQLEEVVVPAHTGQRQGVGPGSGQGGFQRALRRFAAAALQRDSGQGLAVHLAVGVERQRIHHPNGGWKHVVGQPARQPLAQRGGVQLLAGLQRHIGQQARAGRAFVGQGDGLAHLRQVQQLRLHLPQLDAQPPDLHLVVQPAQVVDLPLRVPAHQVARAVEPLAPAEGAGHEAFGREARLVQVAPRQADAADVELSGHALGHGVQVGVQDVGLGVADGPAYGYLAAAIVPAGPAGDVDGGLGGAVEVLQAHALQSLQRLALGLRGHGFAADHDVLEPGVFFDAGVGQEGLQHGGHEVERGDLVPPDELGDAFGVALLARLGQHQAGALAQGPEDFPAGDVEADGRLVQHGVSRFGLQPVAALHPGHAAVQGPVADGRSLGLAGGAGGVDDVGEVVAVQGDIGVGARFCAQVQLADVQLLDGRLRGDQVPGGFMHQHQAHAAARGHAGQALAGLLGVQRQVGAAGLEDGEDAHDEFGRALHADAHQDVRAHALAAQVVGEAAGLAVELAIGPGLVREEQRGGTFGLAGDLAVDGLERGFLLGV